MIVLNPNSSAMKIIKEANGNQAVMINKVSVNNKMKRPSASSEPTETYERMNQDKCQLFELSENTSASFFTKRSIRRLKAFSGGIGETNNKIIILEPTKRKERQ